MKITNKQKIGAVLVIGLCIVVWQGYPHWKAYRYKQKVAQRIAERGPSRCPDKGNRATQVTLMRGDKTLWTKSIEEMMKLPGSIALKKGRHKDSRALPVAALLPKDGSVHTIEMARCYGKPRAFPVSKFVNETESYIFVANQKKVLKLVNRNKKGEYGGRPFVRGVALIRLVP